MITVEAVEFVELEEVVPVYDIEVPDDHSFQALGIVLHNSQVCASRDGERYKTGTNHPRPPAHPNCRSMLVGSLEGEVMGRRPYVRAFKPVGQIPKGERPADMIGQTAPGTTYAKWFDQQSASFQKEWLGPTRYELYKKGDYSISRFVDPTGKKLTLAELRERDKSTFDELFGESARA